MGANGAEQLQAFLVHPCKLPVISQVAEKPLVAHKSRGVVILFFGQRHQLISEYILDVVIASAAFISTFRVPGPAGDNGGGAVISVPEARLARMTGRTNVGIRSEVNADSLARVSLMAGLENRAMSVCT